VTSLLYFDHFYHHVTEQIQILSTKNYQNHLLQVVNSKMKRYTAIAQQVVTEISCSNHLNCNFYAKISYLLGMKPELV
jgi:hypothetical protein